MSRHEPRAALSGLNLAQVGGGALAAVTAALAASRLGVTGTVLGAAFGSVISTIAGALYTHSLDRAQTRVVATRARIVRAVPGRDAADPAAVPPGVAGVSDGTDLADATHQSEQTAIVPPEPPTRRHLAWGAALGVAAVVFVVAMGAISLLESALGHPVSGSGTQGGTTVGRVLTGDGAAPSSEPTGPASSPDASPDQSQPSSATPSASDQATPGVSATSSPDASAGGGDPASTPSDPTPVPDQSPSEAGTPGAN